MTPRTAWREFGTVPMYNSRPLKTRHQIMHLKPHSNPITALPLSPPSRITNKHIPRNPNLQPITDLASPKLHLQFLQRVGTVPRCRITHHIFQHRKTRSGTSPHHDAPFTRNHSDETEAPASPLQACMACLAHDPIRNGKYHTAMESTPGSNSRVTPCFLRSFDSIANAVIHMDWTAGPCIAGLAGG